MAKNEMIAIFDTHKATIYKEERDVSCYTIVVTTNHINIREEST